MQNKILVDMADLKMGKASEIITTLGLGSCVGVTMYDPYLKIGGMLHAMLPYRTNLSDKNISKFVDTGINELLRRMVAAGSRKANIIAKMAGGAHMFSQGSNDVIKVGERNAQAGREILKSLGIPLKAEETGGTFGRTIELDCETGMLNIRTIGHGSRQI